MKNVDSITVRMYNTGSVGDCLFLQFIKEGAVSFNMLIDCGGFNTKTETITSCVKDIKGKLSGAPLDLLVVTHEHLDHVSGFNQAKTEFKGIAVKRVWMAWTEDPSDHISKKLKKELGKKLAALIANLEKHLSGVKKKSAAAGSVSSLNRRYKAYAQNWSDTLLALEFENGRSFLKGAASSLTISDAMSYVKKLPEIKKKTEMFRKPGEVVDDLKGAEGIKFYILGPPYDEDLSGIKKETDEDEMYSLVNAAAFTSSRAFLNAVEAGEAGTGYDSVSPFHKKYLAASKEKTLFNKMYNSADMKWRQIEEDWVDSTGDMAIALNRCVNNTSLAMAIEFKSSEKVLLFPADAQSGSWISWHNKKVMDDLKNNGGKNTDELLEKTVFYKVGHHGSHNGTASKSGLDKMKSNKLVAFMPLVQDKVPKQWGGSKNFPAKALYKELIKKTSGAIIRTDEGVITDDTAKELRDKNLSAAMRKKLKDATHPLFHEWTVEG